MVLVTIVATNWDNDPGPYNWVIKQGETVIASESHEAGYNWIIELPVGTYTFNVENEGGVGDWHGVTLLDGYDETMVTFGPVNYMESAEFEVFVYTPPVNPPSSGNWYIGGITFPFGPSQITDEVDSVSEEFPLNGVASILFALGKGVRAVMISGTIYSPMQDKEDLESTYIGPLRAYQGTQQTVESPSGTYDGEWLVKKVSFREQAEGSTTARILYTITLWKPAVLVVL